MNFVADAYSDLRDYIYQAANMGQYNNTDTKFLPLEPKAGWSSYPNQYRKYSNLLYKSYGTGFLEDNQRASEVKSFTTFVKSFSGFLEGIMPEFPVTPSGFVLSKRYSPESTGFIIELIDAAHGDDKVKYEDAIQDPNFLFFVGAARQFGFMIDKNAPWRLVADIKSSKMQEYMSKYPEKPEDPGDPVAPDDPCVVAQDLFSEYLGEKIQFTSPTIIDSDYSALGKVQEIICDSANPDQATFKIKTYCPGSDDDLLDSTSGVIPHFDVVWPDVSPQLNMMNGPSSLPDVALSNYRRVTPQGSSPDLTVVGLFPIPVVQGSSGLNPRGWQPITWLNSDMTTQPRRSRVDVSTGIGGRSIPIQITSSLGVDEFRWEVVQQPTVFGVDAEFVDFDDPSVILGTVPNSTGQPIAYSDSATTLIRLKLGGEVPGDYVIKVEGYDLSNPLVPRKVNTEFLTLRLRVFYTLEESLPIFQSQLIIFPPGVVSLDSSLEQWSPPQHQPNHWSIPVIVTGAIPQHNNITVSEFYTLLVAKIDAVWSRYQAEVRLAEDTFRSRVFAGQTRTSGASMLENASWVRITGEMLGDRADVIAASAAGSSQGYSDPTKNWLFYFIRFLRYMEFRDTATGVRPMSWHDLYYKRYPAGSWTRYQDPNVAPIMFRSINEAHSLDPPTIDNWRRPTAGTPGLTYDYRTIDFAHAMQFLSNVVRRPVAQYFESTSFARNSLVYRPEWLTAYLNHPDWYNVGTIHSRELVGSSRVLDPFADFEQWALEPHPRYFDFSVMDFIDFHGIRSRSFGSNRPPWTDNTIGTQGHNPSTSQPYITSNDLFFEEFIGDDTYQNIETRQDVSMSDIGSWLVFGVPLATSNLQTGAAINNPSLWDQVITTDPYNDFDNNNDLYEIVRDAYQALVYNTAYDIIQLPATPQDAVDTSGDQPVCRTDTYNIFVLLEQMANQNGGEFIFAEKNNRAFQKKRTEYDRVIQNFLLLQEKYEAHVEAKNIYDAQLVQWNSIHDPVTLQHGGPLSFDNLFKRQFEYTSAIDLETIKKYFYNVYNSYALAVPLKTVPRINKRGDGVQLCMIDRELISQQDIDALYPDSWWLNLYYKLRVKESGRIITPPERRSFQSRLTNLLSGVDATTSSQDRAKIMKQVAQLIHKETKGVIKEKTS